MEQDIKRSEATWLIERIGESLRLLFACVDYMRTADLRAFGEQVESLLGSLVNSIGEAAEMAENAANWLIDHSDPTLFQAFEAMGQGIGLTADILTCHWHKPVYDKIKGSHKIIKKVATCGMQK